MSFIKKINDYLLSANPDIVRAKYFADLGHDGVSILLSGKVTIGDDGSHYDIELANCLNDQGRIHFDGQNVAATPEHNKLCALIKGLTYRTRDGKLLQIPINHSLLEFIRNNDDIGTTPTLSKLELSNDKIYASVTLDLLPSQKVSIKYCYFLKSSKQPIHLSDVKPISPSATFYNDTLYPVIVYKTKESEQIFKSLNEEGKQRQQAQIFDKDNFISEMQTKFEKQHYVFKSARFANIKLLTAGPTIVVRLAFANSNLVATFWLELNGQQSELFSTCKKTRWWLNEYEFAHIGTLLKRTSEQIFERWSKKMVDEAIMIPRAEIPFFFENEILRLKQSDEPIPISIELDSTAKHIAIVSEHTPIELVFSLLQEQGEKYICGRFRVLIQGRKVDIDAMRSANNSYIEAEDLIFVKISDLELANSRNILNYYDNSRADGVFIVANCRDLFKFLQDKEKGAAADLFKGISKVSTTAELDDLLSLKSSKRRLIPQAYCDYDGDNRISIKFQLNMNDDSEAFGIEKFAFYGPGLWIYENEMIYYPPEVETDKYEEGQISDLLQNIREKNYRLEDFENVHRYLSSEIPHGMVVKYSEQFNNIEVIDDQGVLTIALDTLNGNLLITPILRFHERSFNWEKIKELPNEYVVVGPFRIARNLGDITEGIYQTFENVQFVSETPDQVTVKRDHIPRFLEQTLVKLSNLNFLENVLVEGPEGSDRFGAYSDNYKIAPEYDYAIINNEPRIILRFRIITDDHTEYFVPHKFFEHGFLWINQYQYVFASELVKAAIKSVISDNLAIPYGDPGTYILPLERGLDLLNDLSNGVMTGSAEAVISERLRDARVHSIEQAGTLTLNLRMNDDKPEVLVKTVINTGGQDEYYDIFKAAESGFIVFNSAIYITPQTYAKKFRARVVKQYKAKFLEERQTFVINSENVPDFIGALKEKGSELHIFRPAISPTLSDLIEKFETYEFSAIPVFYIDLDGDALDVTAFHKISRTFPKGRQGELVLHQDISKITGDRFGYLSPHKAVKIEPTRITAVEEIIQVCSSKKHQLQLNEDGRSWFVEYRSIPYVLKLLRTQKDQNKIVLNIKKRAQSIMIFEGAPKCTVTIDVKEHGYIDFFVDHSVDRYIMDHEKLMNDVSGNRKDIDIMIKTGGLLNPEKFIWVELDPHVIAVIEKRRATLRPIITKESELEYHARDFYQVPMHRFAALEAFIKDIGARKRERKKYQLFVEQITNFQHDDKFRLPQEMEKSLKQNGIHLRPYQRSGIHWLNWLRERHLNGLLADDMGLGKTVQTATALALSYKSTGSLAHTLIVCPKSVVHFWSKEINKCDPHMHVLQYIGPDRRKYRKFLDKRKTPIVFVTTYATLANDIEYLKALKFHYVILDEATSIKNPETQKSKACRILRDNSIYRLALTGTPIENNVIELWSMYDFLMKDYLGTYKFFCDNFSVDELRWNPDRSEELATKIRPFMIQRKKKDVAKDIPEKLHMKEYCNLHSGLQQKLYMEYQKTTLDPLAERVRNSPRIDTMSVFSAIDKLKQICDHPALASTGSVAAILGQSEKFDLIVQKIEEIVHKGEKFVVFSQFLKSLALLESVLSTKNIVHRKIIGSTEQKKRVQIISDFNSDKKINGILISLKAGGSGITLNAANHVIHLNRWWNPAVEDQATDRVHRIGQEKTVYVYNFTTERTIEERIETIIESKRDLQDVIIGQAMTKELKWTKEELLELLKPFDENS